MAVSPKHPDEELSASPNGDGKESLRRESELLTDTFFNALPYGVLFLSADGRILRANDDALREMHLDRSIEGRPFREVAVIQNREENLLPRLLAELKAGARRVELPDHTFIQRHDKSVHLFISGHLTRLDGEEILFTFRNVVEALTRDFMLKMALSSTKIFPWFYDFDRGTMIIDSRYFEYTRIPTTNNTMSLEEFNERIHPDEREAMAHAFTLQLSGHHYPYPVPFRLLRGDGKYEWFEGQSSYLGQIEGIPYRVVGICMSTQAHKDIEEALTHAKDKAEQSDRLKSAFLANMSHEIRTPLNAIVGFSNLLTGGEIPLDSEEAREYAELIGKNCDHLLTLVSDILDLSRIESDSMEYIFAEHALGQLLSDIYRNQSHIIPEGVRFNLLLPHYDVRIETDALRLRQVIGHLLSNAAKFTREGRIDVGYSTSGDTVRIFVSDTGCGIPEEKFETIFERFEKIDEFAQGAGLGLSICKTISRQLGGTITVNSRPGEGSRFTVCLPLRRGANTTKR